MCLTIGTGPQPMTAGRARIPLHGLAALAAAGWLALAAQTLWWPEASHWPARLGTLALGLALLPALLRGPQPLLLLSPLTGFSLLCPVFYSLVPALVADRMLPFTRPAVVEGATAFLNGRAELLVLQFVLMCVGATVLVAARCGEGTNGNRPAWSGPVARRWAAGAAGLCVLLAAVLVARQRVPAVAAFMEAGAGRQILHGVPPLLSVSVAVLYLTAAGGGRRWLLLALGGGLVGGAALIGSATAKVAVYMHASAFVLYCIVARPRIVALAGAVSAILAVLCVGAIALSEVRSNAMSEALRGEGMSVPARMADTLIYKIAARQTETVNCLQRVVKRHLDAPAPAGSPFYFLSAVVPRVLWPEKPSLSLGSSYAVAYCGYGPKDMPADGSHSLSITLIGQPLAHAGLAGLAAAQIFAVAVLALASLFATRLWPAGAVALAALAPWLADFDQSFALYVANGSKMFLYMLPVLAAVALMSQREPAGRSRPGPAHHA